VLGVAAIGMIAASYYANSYALNSKPFRVREVTDFDFDTLSSSMQVDACNLTTFPATFDRFEATMNYQRDDFASMPIDGGTVMPYQSTSLDGRPALNANTVSGLIIAFAAAMAGHGLQ
jgi:polyisoprenoid-binding protein YceI